MKENALESGFINVTEDQTKCVTVTNHHIYIYIYLVIFNQFILNIKSTVNKMVH